VLALIASGSVAGLENRSESGEAATAISRLRRSTIAEGVPAGANTPTQMSTSNPPRR
jgi:hypothetical protein